MCLCKDYSVERSVKIDCSKNNNNNNKTAVKGLDWGSEAIFSRGTGADKKVATLTDHHLEWCVYACLLRSTPNSTSLARPSDPSARPHSCSSQQHQTDPLLDGCVKSRMSRACRRNTWGLSASRVKLCLECVRAYCRLKIEGILHKFRGGIFFSSGRGSKCRGTTFSWNIKVWRGKSWQLKCGSKKKCACESERVDVVVWKCRPQSEIFQPIPQLSKVKIEEEISKLSENHKKVSRGGKN